MLKITKFYNIIINQALSTIIIITKYNYVLFM